MTFRRKLVALFALTVFLSVACVAWLVLLMTKNAFEKTENQQTAALVEQFQREFAGQGEDVARHVEAIVRSDAATRMAIALNTASANSAEYFDIAHSLAENHQLDFLEILDWNGVIISSAQWPAKFGYSDGQFENLSGLTEQPAFLKLEELPDSTALGLFALRYIKAADHAIYVIGGRRLDQSFLSALNLAPAMRVLLYQNRGAQFSTDQFIDPASGGRGDRNRPAEKFRPLINAVRQDQQETTGIINWTADQADQELFHAIPLRGVGKDHPLIGILLVGNSRRSYVELKRRIRDSALLVGGAGIVLAILLSSWAAARVTRPLGELARAAQDVTAGDWNASVSVAGRDEVAQLAKSFNRMTSELLAQKERLVQTERVAAWRELARRLAHELKNPLFPLQLTVENLVRARSQSPEQFDEVFRESSHTLLGEIANLKGIIGRFSEFSRMPQPQFQQIQVNQVLRDIARLFQAQFESPGRPAIQCKLELDDTLPAIPADPELLHRVVSNLVLNAMDAMPDGGSLTLRSRNGKDKVLIEVADSGSGLTREECERIFTPYYTSKKQGTGLGLAIVQSVVSDHSGRINVQSEPGKGTIFVIELPRHQAQKLLAAQTERETVFPGAMN